MRILLVLLLLIASLQASNKIALLIGNSEYRNLDRLSSPSKDIPDLANKLKGMGFDVTPLYDLDEKAMKRAINRFKRKLQSNPDAIALFYYSGHGSQAYGDSYLIPIDGDTRDQGDVEADGVKVENIAQKMANARTKVNILFLDACRNVPTGTMGGGTKGLGNVKRKPPSTLILYSTSKNKTAQDDRVFNRVVLSKLDSNMEFASLANRISYTVSQKTGGKQVPELLSTGLPDIVLNANSCTKVVFSPTIYRTVRNKYLFKPSYKIYKWIENNEEKTLEPKFISVHERVLASEASLTLKKDKDNLIKRIPIPATYKKIEIYKIKKDINLDDIPKYADYKSISIPAKYKVVSKRVVVKLASEKTISVPCK